MAEKETQEFISDAELDENLDEATAADTLKPGGAPGESRAEMLATFTALLAQLGKEDLTSLYDRTVAEIGNEAVHIPADASAKNQATIAAKKTVSEDVAEMFAGDDLSEDFREKASTLFEAAVNTRVALTEAELQEQYEAAVAEIQEQFEEQLVESSNQILEEVAGKLDQYLDYVVETWMQENELAIENSLRADIAEDFIHGLHNLFAEHYVRVPDEQLDLVAEMKAENEALRARLNETIDEKLALESVVVDATKEAALDEVSEGLAETQVEKLRVLAEGIEYTDADTYRRKLEIVKENYFSGKSTQQSTTTGLITEEIISEAEEGDDVVVPAHMQAYVKTISKIAK